MILALLPQCPLAAAQYRMDRIWPVPWTTKWAVLLSPHTGNPSKEIWRSNLVPRDRLQEEWVWSHWIAPPINLHCTLLLSRSLLNRPEALALSRLLTATRQTSIISMLTRGRRSYRYQNFRPFTRNPSLLPHYRAPLLNDSLTAAALAAADLTATEELATALWAVTRQLKREEDQGLLFSMGRR